MVSLLRGLLLGGFVLVVAYPLLGVAERLEDLIGPGLPTFDSGATTPVARALILALVLFCAIVWLLDPTTPGTPRRWKLVLGGLIGAWALAAATSVCPVDSWLRWEQLFAAALFFFVAAAVCAVPERFELAVHVFLGTATLVALGGFALFVLDRQPEVAATGTFYQADVAAGYYLLAVPVALAMAVGARTLERTVFYSLTTVILGGNLLLTYSRGGQLATLLACLGVVAVLVRRASARSALRLRAVLLPALLALVTVVGCGLVTSVGAPHVVPQKLMQRTAELGRSDTSVQARLVFYRGALRMFAARPLTGWGPATFGRILPRFQGDVRYYSRYVHNEYLTLASEGGMLSLGAFLVLLALLARTMARGIRRVDDDSGEVSQAAILVGIGGALLAAAVHLGVDVDWEFPVLEIAWFALAGMAVARIQADAPPETQARPRLAWRWAATLVPLVLLVLTPFPCASERYARASQDALRHGDSGRAVAFEELAAAWMPLSGDRQRSLADALLALAESRPGRDLNLGGEAERAARAAIRRDPERAVNYGALARAHLYLGDENAFVADMEAAIRRDPINFPDFYNLLADLAARRGHLRRAFALLMTPASAYPPDVFHAMWFFRRNALYRQLLTTFLKLGQLEQQEGRLPVARRWLQRAVDTDPASILARFQLGMLEMSLGDPGAAFAQYREIQRMKPGHPLTRWLLGLCYRELGQAQRARDLLAQAFRADPQLARVGRPGAAPLRIPPDFFAPAPAPATEPTGLEPRP